MLSIQDVSAEQLAKLFHHYQDALAHDCAGHNNEDGSSWDRIPPERTQGDGSRSPLDAARIINGTPAVEPKPQILCQAGRGGVGMLTSVTQHAPKLWVGE
jgi:hypothetical protein